MRKNLTGGTHKRKQEIEAKKGKLWSSLGFRDIIQEANVREKRESKELRSNAL